MTRTAPNGQGLSRGVSGVPRVPTLVVVVSGLLLAVCISMMFVGGVVSGITWDEEVHVRFLNSYLTNGWNVDPSGVIDGRPDPSKIWGIYVYGPVAGLFAHAVTILVSQESWGSLSLTPGAYVGRHIATSLLAIGGIIAVLATVKFILNSWRWAVIGAALLATIPLWVGHGMFNIKDIPVASGYAVATAGLVLALRHLPQRYGKGLWSGWLLVLVGTVLAAGTRMASGVPIALGVVITSLAIGFFSNTDKSRKHELRSAVRFLLQGTAAMVLSYLCLLVIYPKAFVNPILLAYESVYVSAKFPFEETVMTSGRWLSQPVSWSYLPEWFGSQLPLIVIVGVIGFFCWWMFSTYRIATGKCSANVRKLQLLTVPVLLQFLIVPLGAIVFQSNIYNGTRQFLFVLPAAAVMAAVCLARLSGAVLSVSNSKTLPTVVWSAILLGIVAPTAAQISLFPYNYTYYNFPTSLAGIDNRWPTDYWRQSGRELVRLLPSSGEDSCSYEQYRHDELVSCMGITPFRTFAAERGIQAQTDSQESSRFWYIRENQGDVTLPAGCEPYESITRRLFFSEITIAQIATCDLAQASSGFKSPAE